MKNDSLISAVVDYLATLSEGTEISTSEAIDKVYGHELLSNGSYKSFEDTIDFIEFCEIDSKIRKAAKQRGILLDDSRFEGMAVGLPVHIPYVVKRTKTFSQLVKQAKTMTVDAVGTITELTLDIASSAQKAIETTTEKITSEIEERKIATENERKNEVKEAMEPLSGSFAEQMLVTLGNSPLELTKRRIDIIHNVFPIPREQCVLWADAEFDLRPSGIVCTEKGVYIKTNTTIWGKKESSGDKSKDTKKQSVLYFYPWSEFESSWFADETAEDNMALSVEPQCSERFILACKSLASVEVTLPEAFDLDIKHGSAYSDTNVTKVSPIAGAAVESAQTAVFVEQKASINTPAGHGEMAEEAITMLDKLQGLDARVIGRDNAKDGADRVIGNDIFIQTKYYNSARGSLEACFNPENGQYRYMNGDVPMQLEVPKDQYDRVLEGFKKKIADGKVPGIADPNEATSIVRKGKLTYQQAVNLTKSGTVESLKYDALTGAVTCSCAFGLTFLVTAFITWRKTGDINEAIQTGVAAGIQVFGISFIQHMIVSQVARTSLANSFMGPSQYIVGKLGTQASATLINGIRILSGKSAIYGAAASKHLAKILRSNVLTSAITFVAFSVPETYNLAANKISVSQYTKNMSVLAGSIAGGAGGAVAAGVVAAKIGGAAGTGVAPGVGTVIGIAGGFLGGVVGAKAVSIIGDVIHEDDIESLSRLFNAYVSCLISEYMLNSQEMDKLIARLDGIKQKEFKTFFETLHKADTQENEIRNFLEPHFEAVINEREPFELPSAEKIIDAIIVSEVIL